MQRCEPSSGHMVIQQKVPSCSLDNRRDLVYLAHSVSVHSWILVPASQILGVA
jgi:hypothetical protein